MYNRYIPQADGSYRRNRIPDQAFQPEPLKKEQSPPCPPPPPPQSFPEPQEQFRQQRCGRQQPPQKQDCPRRKEPTGSSVTGFLRQLLPKDFDTGDLLVVLLLLLMSADCHEDQNTAL